MINASITEKLALCMLRECKSLYGAVSDTQTYLLISMLSELADGGSVTLIEEKHKWYEELAEGGVRVSAVLPLDNSLRLYYNSLAAYEKEGLPFSYALSPDKLFSDKNARAIIESLTNALINKGFARQEKKRLVVNEQVAVELAEEIRSYLLSGETLEKEAVSLLLLLEKWGGGILKKYVSAYERKTYKARIKTILEDKNDPNTRVLRKILTAKEEHDAALSATIVLLMS